MDIELLQAELVKLQADTSLRVANASLAVIRANRQHARDLASIVALEVKIAEAIAEQE